MELARTAGGTTGIDPSYTVSGAHFTGDGDKGFVLAYNGSDDGRIYYTQDGGKAWSELSSVCAGSQRKLNKIKNVVKAID